MAITADEIRTIVDDLLETREENIIKHITLEGNKVTASIEALSNRLTVLENKVQENERIIEKQSATNATYSDEVSSLKEKFLELEDLLDDQINRGMRNTLVIKISLKKMKIHGRKLQTTWLRISLKLSTGTMQD